MPQMQLVKPRKTGIFTGVGGGARGGGGGARGGRGRGDGGMNKKEKKERNELEIKKTVLNSNECISTAEASRGEVEGSMDSFRILPDSFEIFFLRGGEGAVLFNFFFLSNNKKRIPSDSSGIPSGFSSGFFWRESLREEFKSGFRPDCGSITDGLEFKPNPPKNPTR